MNMFPFDQLQNMLRNGFGHQPAVSYKFQYVDILLTSMNFDDLLKFTIQ